jgi:hypothetical protein
MIRTHEKIREALSSIGLNNRPRRAPAIALLNAQEQCTEKRTWMDVAVVLISAELQVVSTYGAKAFLLCLISLANARHSSPINSELGVSVAKVLVRTGTTTLTLGTES